MSSTLVYVVDVSSAHIDPIDLGYLVDFETKCLDLVNTALDGRERFDIPPKLFKGDVECLDMEGTLNYYENSLGEWVVKVYRGDLVPVQVRFAPDGEEARSADLLVPETISATDLCKEASKVLSGRPSPERTRLIHQATDLGPDYSLHDIFERLGDRLTKVEIQVFERLTGGGWVDLRKSPERKRFAKTGPPWRRASAGLNIGGLCNGADCEARGQLVVRQFGSETTFKFANHCYKSTCPMCNTYVEPTLVVFTKTEFNIHWMKSRTSESGTPLEPEKAATGWRVADADSYLSYSKEQLGVAEFTLLDVYVRLFDPTKRALISEETGVDTASLVCDLCEKRLAENGDDSEEVYRCGLGHRLHPRCNDDFLTKQGRSSCRGYCSYCEKSQEERQE